MPFRLCPVYSLFSKCLLVLLLGGVLTACKSTEPYDGVEIEPFTLQLYNSNPLDVNVYAVLNQTRYRLGQLGTTKTRTFTLPPELVVGSSLVRFEADPIGSAVVIFIDEMVVFPGEEVSLTVPSYNRR